MFVISWNFYVQFLHGSSVTTVWVTLVCLSLLSLEMFNIEPTHTHAHTDATCICNWCSLPAVVFNSDEHYIVTHMLNTCRIKDKVIHFLISSSQLPLKKNTKEHSKGFFTPVECVDVFIYEYVYPHSWSQISSCWLKQTVHGFFAYKQ